MSKYNHKCKLCNRKAYTRCSICWTPYCSRKCQLLDWYNNTHKNICHAIMD